MVETVGGAAAWGAFLVLVLGLLALDLGVFHRRDRPVGTREALFWTGFWVVLSLGFCAAVWGAFGPQRGMEWLTAYVLEKSLSVDNLFVFLVLFGALRIPARYQHRVLFWGILTALVLRGGMILAGAALLARFGWLLLAFGAFLVVVGVRLVFHSEEEHRPERSLAYRVLRRVLPATDRLDGPRFLVREGGRTLATPLLVALALIETSDVVFALDSIPAVFGVTLDPFIVFTSNVFAILGLRSLYFAMAALVDRFVYLHYGLAAVLVFIGAKMLASPWVHVSPALSLAVVAALLGASVAVSFLRRAHPAAR